MTALSSMSGSLHPAAWKRRAPIVVFTGALATPLPGSCHPVPSPPGPVVADRPGMSRFAGAKLLFFLALASGCSGGELSTDSTDAGGNGATGAARIVLERQGALGFCPRENQFIDATLTRTEQGFTLEGSVFLRRVPSADCSEAFPECLVTAPVGPLALSDADATRLDDLIGVLRTARRIESSAFGACEGTYKPACDPCLVQELAVDGERHEDSPCAPSPCLAYARSLVDVETFIDGLAPPPG